jgi:hypothetical protein
LIAKFEFYVAKVTPRDETLPTAFTIASPGMVGKVGWSIALAQEKARDDSCL